MTNFFQIRCFQVFGELVPPVDVAGQSAGPVFDFKLGEFGGQVHDGDGNDLRLPNETECGAQAEKEQQIILHWLRKTLP